MDVLSAAVCPACGGCSFRAMTRVSDARDVVPALECLDCGVLVAEDDPSAPLGGGWVSEDRPTWTPPSKRQAPCTSGTFEVVPSVRAPLPRKA